MIDVSVILPTYNEAENMRWIIPKLAEVLAAYTGSFEILVVDDDSPDGTADVASDLALEYPVRVHLRKSDRGLAAAVIKGFELAKGDIVVVMDADMSHPVDTLPGMIQPILQGACEATVGSRYTAGGGSENWPLARRMTSRGAGILARGVTSLSDPTSGFMAIRKSLLDGVELDPIGWKIVLEVVVKTNPSLREIPISFADRVRGESKLSGKAQLDYLRHLWRLHHFKYRFWFEFLSFCLVGLSGLVIDTAILVAFVELLGLDPRTAAVFAFLGAVTWNFKLNQRWTFPADRYARSAWSRYAIFVSLCILGLSIRIGAMHLLLSRTVLGEGKGYIVASIAGILAATLFNFLGSRYLVFGRKESES